MTRREDADTTPKDVAPDESMVQANPKRGAKFSESGSIDVVRIARRTEIHLANVGRIGQVVDLRSLVRRGLCNQTPGRCRTAYQR